MHRIVSFIFLIGFGLRLVFAISTQLQAFHEAMAEAKEELQSIKTTFGVDDEELLRQRRRTIDELLSNFQKDVNMADEAEQRTDDWYSELHSKTYKGKDCGANVKKKNTNLVKDLNAIAKHDDNYKGVKISHNQPKEYLTDDFDSKNEMDTNNMVANDNGATKEQFDDLNDACMSHDNVDADKSQDSTTDLDTQLVNKILYDETMTNLDLPNDITKLDEKKNDLSHEANYKLSKIEQEAAEKKKNSNGSRKNSDLEKRSSMFNPMNEIKLKTSRRLMRKGYGPSLPSYSLIDSRREMMIDDMLKSREGAPENKEHKFDDFEKLDELLSLKENNEGKIKYRNKRWNDMNDQEIGQLKRESASGGMRSGSHENIERPYRIRASNENVHPTKFGDYNDRMKRFTDETIDEEKPNGGSTVNEYTKEFPESNRDVAKNQRNDIKDSEEEVKRESTANIIDMDVENLTEDMNRKKRAASYEDYKFPLNDDFDTVELNQDEMHAIHKITKRSAKDTEKRSDYKINKRSTSMVDEADYNNGLNPTDSSLLATVRGDGVARENDYEDISARKKHIISKDFDFGNTARSFEQEQFDNLKQKVPDLSTFDGMKFNNLWYDSNHNDRSNSPSLPNFNNMNGNSFLRAGGNTSNKDINESAKRGSDTPPVKVDNKEADKNMILALRDEILNSTAYSKLENFLKLYSPNSSSVASVDVSLNHNTSSSAHQGKMNPVLNSSPLSNVHLLSNGTAVANSHLPDDGTNSAISSDKTTSISGDKKDDMMKLNITINASVTGDQKKNNFVGNGTINVKSCGEERERRGIGSSKFDVTEKRKYPSKELKQSCGIKNENAGNKMFPLDNMVTGKLSSQVVKSVFSLVRTNPKLRKLWPSLQNNRPATKQQLKNFYAIRNFENESEIHRTELMLQKAMETINEIIDQQVRSRTCVPLRPDLVDFYEMILQTYAEQDKSRAKRQSSLCLVSDFSKDVRTIDPNKIEDKSRIVKKLLKQYEELPHDDQQEVSALRDDLLTDLVYLRKLKSNQDIAQERRKREVVEQQLVKLNESDSELIRKLEQQYTTEYMKLLKTSELFMEAAGEQ